MVDISKCIQCDRDNTEDGVYTSGGEYLCGHCIHIIVTLEDEYENN